MPKIPKKPVREQQCKACRGTCRNSQGGPCFPCLRQAAIDLLDAVDGLTGVHVDKVSLETKVLIATCSIRLKTVLGIR